MKRLIFILLIIVTGITTVFAGNETVYNAIRVKDLILNGSNFGIVDNKATQPVTFQNKETEGRVILKFNEATNLKLVSNSNDYSIKITYDIVNIITASGASASNQVGNILEIQNKSVETEINKGINLYKFKDVKSFAIKVTEIKVTIDDNIPLVVQPAQVDENIMLELQITADRNYDANNINQQVWNINNRQLDLNGDGDKDEIEIYWNFKPGYEEYELEWVFVNDYSSTSLVSFLPANQVFFDFRNNATKVRISENFYRLPLVFDRGYLIYRVRGVHKTGTGFVNEAFSNWSAYAEKGNVYDLKYMTVPVTNMKTPYPDVNFAYINSFEKEINWQFIATYAEGGLNKSLVNFMDGTMRSRQNVTKNNSDKEVLVSEKIYDYQGRAAVEILPSPAPIPIQTKENAISYFERFNKSSSATPAKAYSKDDFDWDQGSCSVDVKPLSLLSGTGLYYSINNPDKKGFNAYLPDANGYAFIQTEYTNDNTGRVKRKSNVGAIFQFTSTGKFTEYLYSQPEQFQLNRLFGSNVGYKEHYKRNIVIDPNGQASVSYLNLSGKVVATALEGESPNNLVPLASNTIQAGSASNLLKSNNLISDDYSAISFTKATSVTQNSEAYNLEYEIKKIPTYKDACMPDNFCYECAYDILLELKNTDCNTEIYKFPGAGEVSDVGAYNLNACTLNQNYNSPKASSLSLTKGSYMLRKTLSIDEEILEQYATEYAVADKTKNLCYEPFVTGDVYSRGCDYTCEKCKEDLGTDFANFKTKYASLFPGMDDAGLQSIYDEKAKVCDRICNSKSICDITYDMMLDDVSLNGQYGKVFDMTRLPGGDPISPEVSAISVFNDQNKLPKKTTYDPNWRHPVLNGTPVHYTDVQGNNVLVNISSGLVEYVASATIVTDANGNPCVYPEDLLHFKDFYNIWQPHWAKLLVEYHPEYCYYTWCKDNTDSKKDMGAGYALPLTSNGFDDYLTDLTYAYKDNTSEIITKLNASNLLGTSSQSDADRLKAIMLNDPFFKDNTTVCANKLTSLGYNADAVLTKQQLMIEFMKNYRANGVKSGKSIDVMAWNTNNCVNAYYPDFPANMCLPPSVFYDPANNGRINTSSVISYINYYLHCKNMVKDVFADCYALTNCGCYNECIGKKNFNPFTYGMIPPLQPKFVKVYIPGGLFGAFGHTVYRPIYTQAMISGYINGLGKPYFNDDCQPCSRKNKNFFMNENVQKRFLKNGFMQDEIPGGTSGTAAEEKAKANADYNFFLTSGQCPSDKQLENFLNGKAQPTSINGNLTSSISGTVNLTSLAAFTKDMYDAMLGEKTQLSEIEFAYSTVTNGWAFTIINKSVSNFSKIITLYKPVNLPTTFDITQVKKVTGLRYLNTNTTNGLHNFTVFLSVMESGVMKDYSFAGTTDFAIGQCYSTIASENCYVSDQAVDAVKVAELMCNVQANSVQGIASSTLTSGYSPVPDLALPDCHPASFDLWFGQQKDDNSSTYLQWKRELLSSNVIKFSVKRDFNTTTSVELGITISSTTLDFSTPDNMYLFKNFKKTGNNSYTVDVYYANASLGTVSASNVCNVTIALISTPNTVFPTNYTTYNATSNNYDYFLNECVAPEANSCSQQVFKNAEQVLNVLKRLKEIGKLSTPAGTPFALIPGHVFTQELRNALDGVQDIEKVYWEGSQTGNQTTGYTFSGRIYYDAGTTGVPQKDLLKLEIQSPADVLTANFTTAALVADPAIEGDATYNFLISAGTVTMKGKSNLQMKNCVLCIPDPNVVNYQTKHKQTFEYGATFTTEALKAIAVPANGEYNIMSPADFTGRETGGCVIGANNKPPVMVYKHGGGTKILWKKRITIKPGARYKFIAEMAVCSGNFQVSMKINGDYKLIDVGNTNFTDYSYSASGSNVDFWTAPCTASNIPSQPCLACSSTNPCEVDFEITTTEKTASNAFLFLDNIRILEERKCVPDNFTVIPFTPKSFPCDSLLSGFAAHSAYTQNNQLLVQLKEKFKKAYRKRCLEALDTPEFEEMLRFYSKAPATEYQYTLYYYDQAGNLVQTVPPQGVTPLTSTSEIDDADAKRTSGTVEGPNHNLPTTYSYNSLNQVVEQTTPDAGLSHFWYDELGRVVFSQNAKQQTRNVYSYTEYDAIGRIVEVGEISKAGATLDANLVFLDETEILAYKTGAEKTQITRTSYDYDNYLMPGFNTVYSGFTHDNLRNRVAAIAVFNKQQDMPEGYVHATHYSYDIHGNVKSLIQDNKYYADYVEDNAFERYKRVDYEYDLISGKVNKVIYQPGAQDQFMHRYEYDADNRITHVYTSQDDVIWEKDAKYFYYRHGPLARTEIGDLTVQGIDYAYTLQGWIKGINSNQLKSSTDIGRDAMSDVANLHQKFAADLASYSLAYYNDDYKPVNNTLGNQNFVADPSAVTDLATNAPGLYNGNISHMVSTIMQSGNPMPQLTAYSYDQLNRIKLMTTLGGNVSTVMPGNTWTGSLGDKYYEEYNYDDNGNILSLKRKNSASQSLDELTYDYNITQSNRLNNLNQNSGNSAAVKSSQYTYDDIGNLASDAGENISQIGWNVYGKVTNVTQTDSDPDIEFIYDAMGNRIGKKVIKKNGEVKFTFYVRDAQGNILATYTAIPKNVAVLNDFHIYGSSRLGTKELNMAMLKPAHPLPVNPNQDIFARYLGYKKFEVNNHLGNVLTIFTDRKMPQGTLNSTINSYQPVLIASQDYYPFGMQMDSRGTNAISGSTQYRFGFNGKENDDETYGDNNEYDFGARIYDPRIGRWLSVDPLAAKYSGSSPYNFTLNNPIFYIDLGGKEVVIHGEDKIQAFAALQKTTSLILTMDVNGNITAKLPKPTIDKETGFVLPPPITQWDNALYDAIKDQKVQVNLYTTKASFYDSKDGEKNIPILPAANEGSEINGDKVETTQIINMDMVQKIEDAGLDNSGKIVGHEVLESYFGGKDSPGASYNATMYESSHNKANSCEENVPSNNSMYQNKNNNTGFMEFGYMKSDGSNKVKLSDSSQRYNKFNKDE